jgi:hypothetical protein
MALITITIQDGRDGLADITMHSEPPMGAPRDTDSQAQMIAQAFVKMVNGGNGDVIVPDKKIVLQ